MRRSEPSTRAHRTCSSRPSPRCCCADRAALGLTTEFSMRLLHSFAPIAAVAALAAAPLAAQTPQPPPPPPQIVTNGEGEAQVTPDRARVHVAVETRGKTAAEAAAEN